MTSAITLELCFREYKKILGKDIINTIYYHLNTIIARQNFTNHLLRNRINPVEFNKMLIDNNAIVAGTSILNYYIGDKCSLCFDIFVKKSGEAVSNIEKWITSCGKVQFIIRNKIYKVGRNIISINHFFLDIGYQITARLSVIVLTIDPQEFVEIYFDMDCCKLMYNGMYIYGDLHVCNNINKRITYSKLSSVYSNNHNESSKNKHKNIPYKDFYMYREYTDHIKQFHSDEFCTVYKKYKMTSKWDSREYQDIDIDILHKLENIIDLDDLTNNVNKINYDRNKLEHIIEYILRIKKYRNKGFVVIDKLLN